MNVVCHIEPLRKDVRKIPVQEELAGDFGDCLAHDERLRPRPQ
jgi:hypothetical protein